MINYSEKHKNETCIFILGLTTKFDEQKETQTAVSHC